MLTYHPMRFGTDHFGVTELDIAGEGSGGTVVDGGDDDGGGVNPGGGDSGGSSGGGNGGETVIIDDGGGGGSGGGGLTDIDEGNDNTDSNIVAPFYRYALLRSQPNSGTGWTCTNTTAAYTGFYLSYSKPVDTNIAIMFRIKAPGVDETKYYAFKGEDLTLITEDSSKIDVHFVLANGNTPEQLALINSLSGFSGNYVYPIIALRSSGSASPTIKIGVKKQNFSNTLTKEFESEVYTFSNGEMVRIDSADADITVGGTGSVTVKAQLYDADGAKIGSYSTLDSIIEKEAASIQFKMNYAVTSVDEESFARVNKVVLSYSSLTNIVTVSEDSTDVDLYTEVTDYEVPLQMCYVIVRHDPLVDSEIAAKVNFMRPPDKREYIKIGQATGVSQELTLGLNGVADPKIIGSSIKIYANETELSNFVFNTETSTVVVSATSGQIIYATYEYNHDVEVWHDMTIDATEPYNPKDGTCATRFIFTLPDADATDKCISNVRLTLKRKTGSVTAENLGTITTHRKLITLKHQPSGVVTFNPTNTARKVSQQKVDVDTYAIRLNSGSSTTVKAAYNWVGNPIVIHSVVCGWSVA